MNKAVVLARGLGTRMRQAAAGPAAAGSAAAAVDGAAAAGGVAADAAAVESAAPALNARQVEAANRGLKAMMPIGPGGRPFLDFILSALADAGYTRVCLVVAPDHQVMREYYTTFAPPRRLRVTFAVQAEARGTADALLAASGFIGAEHVLVINGDNYYPVRALRALRQIESAGTVLFDPASLVRESNIPPERLRAFAIGLIEPDPAAVAAVATGAPAEAAAHPAEGIEADGVLTALIEKPDEQTWRALAESGGSARALISMNCWRLPPAMLDFCRVVKPSSRGELELPQAIRDALAAGMRFRVIRSDEGVLDLSGRADIASVAARLRDVRVEP